MCQSLFCHSYSFSSVHLVTGAQSGLSFLIMRIPYDRSMFKLQCYQSIVDRFSYPCYSDFYYHLYVQSQWFNDIVYMY